MTRRFFDIPYLINTAKIKWRAFRLKSNRKQTPYAYFRKQISPQSVPEVQLKYIDRYHSLNYFNYTDAKKKHASPRSLTQELIIGLALYNQFVDDKNFIRQPILELAKKLEDSAEFKDDNMVFFFNESYNRFDLKGKYSSGLVQGKAASLFIRCFHITNNQKYLDFAKKCLLASNLSLKEGGFERQLDENQKWPEEYPSPTPSMVLNGALFYLIGLSEYLTESKDEILHEKFENYLETILSWMDFYKVKGGLLYSMYRWSLCNVHYTAIMKFQFEHLYKITGLAVFNDFANYTDDLTNWKVFFRLLK